ncbi:MAG: hypothetical protein SFY56_08590 [Bacteroidota bacterium]|nr:hypothetical protein [Bacteroidota bacterium]
MDVFENIEKIEYESQILAIIIRNNFNKSGIHFFTPNEFSQQLAYMNHPAGKIIEPHFHKPIERSVIYTQEVLLLKRGILKVNFYDNQQQFLFNKILTQGDVILLASGGHGFEVIEEIEMIEIKQGPYQGDNDKVRFNANK